MLAKARLSLSRGLRAPPSAGEALGAPPRTTTRARAAPRSPDGTRRPIPPARPSRAARPGRGARTPRASPSARSPPRSGSPPARPPSTASPRGRRAPRTPRDRRAHRSRRRGTTRPGTGRPAPRARRRRRETWRGSPRARPGRRRPGSPPPADPPTPLERPVSARHGDEVQAPHHALGQSNRPKHAEPSTRAATAARSAMVTGMRAARMAGKSPPATPMASAHRSPWARRPGVTRKAKATWENVLKLSVESEAPSQ